MDLRRGFTILEAAVAMGIVGMISIAALAAFSGDLRASQRAREVLPAAALAEERLSAIEVSDPRRLATLADSLAHGRFGEPFAAYEWRANVTPVRGERWLYDIQVRVRWESGEYVLARRRYRPPPAGAP